MESENAGAEVRQLKACISDLLSVLAIQAISRGREPRQVIGALLEVLVGTLRLDLAYAEFKVARGVAPIALARFSQPPAPNDLRREIRASVDTWLRDQSQTSPRVVRCQSTDGDLFLALVKLGIYAQIGWLLACSRREDFPTQTESLILGVAANQAVIGVQQAQLLSQQTHVAQELERKVRQRTKELQTVNVELECAVKQIDTLRNDLQRENLVFRKQAARVNGGLAPWQLRRAEISMTENLSGQVPLSRLAEQCGVSVRHFARAFRQSTGVPPHQWLLNRRVEHAKELLPNSKLSLSTVALACGFGNQSHFTRVFSEAVCMSPGLWRRLQSAPSPEADGLHQLNACPTELNAGSSEGEASRSRGPSRICGDTPGIALLPQYDLPQRAPIALGHVSAPAYVITARKADADALEEGIDRSVRRCSSPQLARAAPVRLPIARAKCEAALGRNLPDIEIRRLARGEHVAGDADPCVQQYRGKGLTGRRKNTMEDPRGNIERHCQSKDWRTAGSR